MPQSARKIRAFVDLSSAYSYIGIHRLDDVAEAHGLEIDWMVFELARIRDLMGSPSPLDQPAKVRHNGPDWLRSCRDAGLPATPPEVRPVSAGLARRTFYAVKNRDPTVGAAFLKAVSARAFGEGKPIATCDDILSATRAASCPVDRAEIEAAAADQRTISALEMAHCDAVKTGVIGAPFFVCGDISLWGADRLNVLDRLISERDCPPGFTLLDPGITALREVGPFFVSLPDAPQELRMKITSRHVDTARRVRNSVLCEALDVALRYWESGGRGAVGSVAFRTAEGNGPDLGKWLRVIPSSAGGADISVLCGGEVRCRASVNQAINQRIHPTAASTGSTTGHD